MRRVLRIGKKLREQFGMNKYLNKIYNILFVVFAIGFIVLFLTELIIFIYHNFILTLLIFLVLIFLTILKLLIKR